MRKVSGDGKAKGFTVDTNLGVVYGKRGQPIGRRNKYGYVEVRRRDEAGVFRAYHAHRLVYEAATGKPIPKGLVVDHLNGVKHDNRIVNLVVATQGRNVERFAKMAAANAALVDSAQRRAISATFGVKTSGEWAEELGVSEEVVHGIRLANLREAIAFAKRIA